MALIEKSGRLLYLAKRAHRVEYSGRTYAEQDAEVWIRHLDELVAETKDALPDVVKKVDLRAVVLSGQRSSVIPVDAAGRPLRKAILWQDSRHRKLCEWLDREYPGIYDLTGSPMNTAYSGPKMLWIKRHEPAVYQASYKLLTPVEFLLFRLCGEAKTDYTYAGRSLLFDMKQKCWNEALIRDWGLDQEKLAAILPPGSQVGYLQKEWVKRWRVLEKVPVITAGGDQQCSALALGVYAEGRYEITAGTGGYVTTLSHELPEKFAGFCVNPSALPGAYNYETTMPACSAAFDYLSRLFYPSSGYEALDALLADVVPGAGGVQVLPFFQGSGSPDWRSEKKAQILNLSLGTSAQQILQATVESMACEFKEHLELLENAAGRRAEKIMLAGGMSRNGLFKRSLAALLGRRLERPVNFESSLYGAFMCTAVKLGWAESYEAAHALVRPHFKPEHLAAEAADEAAYAEVYRRYREAKRQQNRSLRAAAEEKPENKT